MKNRVYFEVFIWSLNIGWIEYILHDFQKYNNEAGEFDLKFWIRQKRRRKVDLAKLNPIDD